MAIGAIEVTRLPIDQKISLLAKLIKQGASDDRIRSTAFRILQGVPEFNDMAEANALFTYVRDTIRYTRDPIGKDIFESPIYTLEKRSGDCDSTTVLLGSMMMAVGLPYRLKLVSKDGTNVSIPSNGSILPI